MSSEEWSRWNDGIVEANTRVIEEFRANGGEVGGYFAGAPMLLLHHVGAHSGIERVNPLVYLRDGDDLVVSASKGGDPRNPAWYHDLTAHPEVVVEVGTETVAVEAVEVTGPERDELYARLAAMRPAFAGYESRTDRVIPMFRLRARTEPRSPRRRSPTGPPSATAGRPSPGSRDPDVGVTTTRPA